ncbi:MAG TPA: hypothetical protein V6C78_15760, partial [Crinalium sp.]
MSLSVGPIQSYIPGSTWFDLTQYSDISDQQQVSVNLTSSNLWLVDTSQLNGGTVDTAPISLVGEGQVYQSAGELSATGVLSYSSPILAAAPIGSLDPISSGLTTTSDTSVQYADINGTTGSSSPGFSTDSGSFGSSSVVNLYTSEVSQSSDSATPLLIPGSSGSGTSTATSTTATTQPPGTTSTTSVTTTPGTQPPGSSTSDPGTATSTSLTIPPGTSSGITSDPVPVPFEFSPTLGLSLILIFVYGKRLFGTFVMKTQ